MPKLLPEPRPRAVGRVWARRVFRPSPPHSEGCTPGGLDAAILIWILRFGHLDQNNTKLLIFLFIFQNEKVLYYLHLMTKITNTHFKRIRQCQKLWHTNHPAQNTWIFFPEFVHWIGIKITGLGFLGSRFWDGVYCAGRFLRTVLGVNTCGKKGMKAESGRERTRVVLQPWLTWEEALGWK